jgi:hypothetical protein
MKGCRIKEFKENLPVLPSLVHIDLSDNKIASLKEIEKMKQWPKCTSLIVAGTPLEDEFSESVKTEIIIVIP